MERLVIMSNGQVFNNKCKILVDGSTLRFQALMDKMREEAAIMLQLKTYQI